MTKKCKNCIDSVSRMTLIAGSSTRIRAYHGTPHDFKQFCPGSAQAGAGVFFTTNPEYAKEFGSRLVTVDITPSKPAADSDWFDAERQLQDRAEAEVSRLEQEYDLASGDEADALLKELEQTENELGAGDGGDPEYNAKVSEVLRQQGFDAYITDNQSGDHGSEILVFDPSIIEIVGEERTASKSVADMGQILEYLVDEQLGVAMPDPGQAAKHLDRVLRGMEPEQYQQITDLQDALAKRLLQNTAGLKSAGLLQSLQKVRNPLVIARLMMVVWGYIPETYQDALMAMDAQGPEQSQEQEQVQGDTMEDVRKAGKMLWVSAGRKTADIVADTWVKSKDAAYLIMHAHGIEWDTETQTGDLLGNPIYTYYDGGERVAQYTSSDIGRGELLMYDPAVTQVMATVYNPPPTITAEWMTKAFSSQGPAADAAILMWDKTGSTKWQSVADSLI